MNSSEQQLLNNLNELFKEFKCSLQDLRNPTEEFVTNFYTFWLGEFGLEINNIHQIQFEQQTEMIVAYPDAFSAVIPKINLLKIILSISVVPDFGMLDIVAPAPKRTQSIIRAFTEFFMFCDDRVGHLLTVRADFNERKQRISNLLQEKESFKESLNNITKVIGLKRNEIVELEESKIKLEQKLAELKVEKQIAKSKTDEANAKLKEKEAILLRISKEDNMISNRMKEISRLIVDSPSSILQDMGNLRVKNEELKEQADQKRDMLESKMQDHKKLEKNLADQQQRMLELQELVELIRDYKIKQEEVAAIEKNTITCQEELNELKTTLINITNRKRHCQEELQSLYLKWKTLKPQLTEGVEAALRELNNKSSAKTLKNYSLKEDANVEENITSMLKEIKEYSADFEVDLQMQEQQVDDFFIHWKSCFENKVKTSVAIGNKYLKSARDAENSKKGEQKKK